MKKRIFVYFTIILFSSCNNHIISNDNSSIADSGLVDSLSFELCMIYGSDQNIRSVNNSKEALKVMQSLDSLNFIKIIDYIKKNGFPNKQQLGANFEYECVQLSAFSVLLHNPARCVENDIYKLLREEVKKGNVNPKNIAMILDKYYVYHKGYSLYHTSFGKACISNKKIVNAARIDIGLMKLPDSLFIKCNI